MLGPGGCWDMAAWPGLPERFFTYTYSVVTVRSPWKVSHGRQGGARAPGASGHFTNDTAEAFTRLRGRQWVTLYANPWHGFPLAFLPLQICSLPCRAGCRAPWAHLPTFARAFARAFPIA